MFALFLGALAFIPMLLEARRAAGHDRRLRAAGAVEPAGDVYPLMQVAYPGCFLAMIAEAWLRDAGPADRHELWGLAVVTPEGLEYPTPQGELGLGT